MLTAGLAGVDGMPFRMAGQGPGEAGTGFSYQSGEEGHKMKNLESRMAVFFGILTPGFWILYSCV